jgi:hypothetical protein
VPVAGKLADVGVVGDEVNAESVRGHHHRECLVGRPSYQPGLFPASFHIGDDL